MSYNSIINHLNEGGRIKLERWKSKFLWIVDGNLSDNSFNICLNDVNNIDDEELSDFLRSLDKDIYKWIIIEEDENEDDMNLSFTEKAKSGLKTAAKRTKDDLKDAAWRKATKASISSLRKAILKLLSKNLDNTHIALLKQFLQTSQGEAVLAVLIGTVIPYLPNIDDNEKLSRLGDELRVFGFEGLMDSVFSSFVNPALKTLGDSLKNVSLPEV